MLDIHEWLYGPFLGELVIPAPPTPDDRIVFAGSLHEWKKDLHYRTLSRLAWMSYEMLKEEMDFVDTFLKSPRA